MRALPLGQRVFITDPGHQVAEAGHPGSGFFSIWCHQVQRFHVISMVHCETTGRVEAAVSMPMEDVWLTALCHFVERVDGDWQRAEAWSRKSRPVIGNVQKLLMWQMNNTQLCLLCSTITGWTNHTMLMQPQEKQKWIDMIQPINIWMKLQGR